MYEILLALLKELYHHGGCSFVWRKGLGDGTSGSWKEEATKIILEGYGFFRRQGGEFKIRIVPETEWRRTSRYGSMGKYDPTTDTVSILEDGFFKVVSVGFHEIAEREFVLGAHGEYRELLEGDEFSTRGHISPNLLWGSHWLAMAVQVLLTENLERSSDLGGRMRAATLSILSDHSDLSLGGMFFVGEYRSAQGSEFNRLVGKHVEKWERYFQGCHRLAAQADGCSQEEANDEYDGTEMV